MGPPPHLMVMERHRGYDWKMPWSQHFLFGVPKSYWTSETGISAFLGFLVVFEVTPQPKTGRSTDTRLILSPTLQSGAPSVTSWFVTPLTIVVIAIANQLNFPIQYLVSISSHEANEIFPLGQRWFPHGLQRLCPGLHPGRRGDRDLLHAPAVCGPDGFPSGPHSEPPGPLGAARQHGAAAGVRRPVSKKPADTEQGSKAGHGETAKLRWVSERCNVTF